MKLEKAEQKWASEEVNRQRAVDEAQLAKLQHLLEVGDSTGHTLETAAHTAHQLAAKLRAEGCQADGAEELAAMLDAAAVMKLATEIEEMEKKAAAEEAERQRVAEEAAKKLAEETAVKEVEMERQRRESEAVKQRVVDAEKEQSELDALTDQVLNDPEFEGLGDLEDDPELDFGDTKDIEDLLLDLDGLDMSSASAVGRGAGSALKRGKSGIGSVANQDNADSSWEVQTNKKKMKDNSKTWQPPAIERERKRQEAADLLAIKEGKEWCNRGLFENKTLCCLGPQNKFRLCAEKMVKSTWFDNGVLFLILLNSVLLAVDRPSIENGSFERWFLDASNGIFSHLSLSLCTRLCRSPCPSVCLSPTYADSLILMLIL